MGVPGIHPSVIALAVGYGRQSSDTAKTAEYIGKAANGSKELPIGKISEKFNNYIQVKFK
jgi:hypothetical protein